MKKTSILFAAAFAVVTFLISWTASSKSAAIVSIDEIGCGMLNGDGSGTWTDNTHSVVTSSGNSTLRCQISDVPNSTGKAVIFNFGNTGSYCNTSIGLTDNWQEVVSADGHATLVCKVK